MPSFAAFWQSREVHPRSVREEALEKDTRLHKMMELLLFRALTRPAAVAFLIKELEVSPHYGALLPQITYIFSAKVQSPWISFLHSLPSEVGACGARHKTKVIRPAWKPCSSWSSRQQNGRYVADSSANAPIALSRAKEHGRDR